MGLESWGQFIGLSASIFTILQMLSPIPSCYKIYIKQSVGDMIVTPYVVAMTSSCLWLLYGVIIQDSAVIRVNVVGFILQLCYTTCYYFYCVRKAYVQEQVTVACGAIGAALCYSLLEKDRDRLVLILGLVSCLVTVIFFMSPLANIGYVLRVWNSESLPKLLITSTFIVSVQWTLYGFIIKDKFIQVTNFLGAILSGFQLLLIIIIPAYHNEKLISDI